MITDIESFLRNANNQAQKPDEDSKQKARKNLSRVGEMIAGLDPEKAKTYVGRIAAIEALLIAQESESDDHAEIKKSKNEEPAKNKAPPAQTTEPAPTAKDLPPSKSTVETKSIRIYLASDIWTTLQQGQRLELYNRFLGSIKSLANRILGQQHHYKIKDITRGYPVNRIHVGKIHHFAYTVSISQEDGAQIWLFFDYEKSQGNKGYKRLADRQALDYLFTNFDKILRDAVLVYETSSSALGFGDARVASRCASSTPQKKVYPLLLSTEEQAFSTKTFGESYLSEAIAIDTTALSASREQGADRLNKIANAILTYLTQRGPPEFATDVKAALLSTKIFFTNDLLLLQAKDSLPYIAITEIITKQIFFHTQYLQFPLYKQIEIFYYALVGCMMKTALTREEAEADTIIFILEYLFKTRPELWIDLNLLAQKLQEGLKVNIIKHAGKKLIFYSPTKKIGRASCRERV